VSTALIAALEAHAAERPGAIALTDARGAVTRAELLAATGALAVRLAALGAGARVLVAASNGRELATALLAALASGAEGMGISPATPRATRAELAAQIGARLLLTDDAAIFEAERIDFAALLAAPASAAPLRGDGALLLATSGTTGPPRIARRSARAVDFVAASSARALALGARDRVLLAIPLFHSYGVDQLGAALIAGARVILHARFNPAALRRALIEADVTHLPCVPTMLAALARLAGPETSAPALRSVCSAGAPLPSRVAEQFRTRFGVAPRQIYGASEVGTVTLSDEHDPPGCAGRPLPGIDVRILAREAPDPEKPLARGEEGVVAIGSPARFDGYVDGSDSGDACWVTGDLGRLDERGALWLNGRIGLLIDVGAVKVNPLEVEAVLMRHPAVREAVVLPLAFGETAARLRAVIVPEPGAETTPQELRSFAREHLIDYKVPRVFEIRTDVPRSPSGKILRRELAQSPPASEPS
jgi:acyl-CoA synthetase (AMP-forming)/AMP-acid ligase II